MKRSVTAFLVCLCFKSAFAQLTYPDKHLPSDTPRYFAPGIITDGLSNRDFTISPSGDEIFFTIQHPRGLASAIIRLKKIRGEWSQPEVAPFSGIYRDLEASFSPDGKTLYFSSDRPVEASKPRHDFDIWKVSKMPDGTWGQPQNLGKTVNTAKNEYYPSVTKNGDLYFTVEAAYGKGGEDIVMCRKTDTGYLAPVSLPAQVNSKLGEFNAFVDPDGQFIIFTSYGRSDDMGRGDLYMSRKDPNGNWMPARHLPAPINSEGLDYCPYVTPDKKYFIFTSSRMRKEWNSDKAVTYKEYIRLLSRPGNGQDDIFWVKFNPSW